MNIPGYDAWKLMTPEDERSGDLCPFCGAYSTNSCELEVETGGVCPWDEAQDGDDPDYLRGLMQDDEE